MDEKYVSKDLPDYRKAASYLKRQIKDSKSNRVGSRIQYKGDKSKKYLQWQQDASPSFHMNQFRKEITTDVHKKQKQYPIYHMNPQENLFKNVSVSSIHKKPKNQLKLPTLDKKNVFSQIYPHNHESTQLFCANSQNLGELQSCPKIIKVPMDRLRPIKPEDIRKKFQSKFRSNYMEGSQNCMAQEIHQ